MYELGSSSLGISLLYDISNSIISKTRPLLENSADRRKTITELVDARDVYYREVASLVVDTTGKNLHEVINIIKRETENVE